MRAQRATTNAGAALALLGVLGLCMPLHTAQAGNDRIFTDSFEPSYEVGGTVSGVTGSGLVVYLYDGTIHERLPLSGNGPYNFTTTFVSGERYHAAISGSPKGQFCTIVNFIGIMGSADVNNIDIVCGDHMNWNQSVWGRNWQ